MIDDDLMSVERAAKVDDLCGLLFILLLLRIVISVNEARTEAIDQSEVCAQARLASSRSSLNVTSADVRQWQIRK